MKKAFTVIELVMVIVILGILATIAIPKFGSTGQKAHIAKARSDVSAIRSSILSERQSQLIRGNNSFIDKLSDNDEILFTGNGDGRVLLTYGIASGTAEGKWEKVEDKKYKFHIDSKEIEFNYDSTTGKFSCDRDDSTTGELCKKIVD